MAPQHYWLIKSEPTVYSIDHLKQDKNTHWDGVRNYQARNFMRDQMKVGDLALFYHSNADPSGVSGLARISSPAYPDHTAWDSKDRHYDPKSTQAKPVWMMIDVAFVEKFPHFVSLEELRTETSLRDMLVLKRGSRLSIQPVEEKHFERVCRLGRKLS